MLENSVYFTFTQTGLMCVAVVVEIPISESYPSHNCHNEKWNLLQKFFISIVREITNGLDVC